MRAQIEEIVGHLGAAKTQSLPSDDQIIAGHVSDALAIAKGLLAAGAGEIEALRTPADFSREFAGYMAAAAERYCKAVNLYHKRLLDEGLVVNFTDAALTDAYTEVFGSIYEWRKREAVALASLTAPAPGVQTEALCDDCGGVNPVWFAPNPLWNLVMGGPDCIADPGGFICPRCFIVRAQALNDFAGVGWKLVPESETDWAEAERIQALMRSRAPGVQTEALRNVDMERLTQIIRDGMETASAGEIAFEVMDHLSALPAPGVREAMDKADD